MQGVIEIHICFVSILILLRVNFNFHVFPTSSMHLFIAFFVEWITNRETT